MIVTGIYAALLALLLIYLSIQTISARKSTQTSLGDGGHDEVLRARRAHGNFTEYVPIALILMAIAENSSVNIYVVHVIGLLLLAGRGAHAYAISTVPQPMSMRVRGMQATFAAIIAGALANLAIAFSYLAG